MAAPHSDARAPRASGTMTWGNRSGFSVNTSAAVRMNMMDCAIAIALASGSAASGVSADVREALTVTLVEETMPPNRPMNSAPRSGPASRMAA